MLTDVVRTACSHLDEYSEAVVSTSVWTALYHRAITTVTNPGSHHSLDWRRSRTGERDRFKEAKIKVRPGGKERLCDYFNWRGVRQITNDKPKGS